MKTAKKSIFGGDCDYNCQYEWPDKCHLQCGDHGIVLKSGTMIQVFDAENPIEEIAKKASYRTAFFEAFPTNPKTFIRGEGETIEQAEKQAWDRLQKYLVCQNHEFEARGYENGGGFCKHCNMFASDVIESPHSCPHCGAKTWGDKIGEYCYCSNHQSYAPFDDLILLADRNGIVLPLYISFFVENKYFDIIHEENGSFVNMVSAKFSENDLKQLLKFAEYMTDNKTDNKIMKFIKQINNHVDSNLDIENNPQMIVSAISKLIERLVQKDNP